MIHKSAGFFRSAVFLTFTVLALSTAGCYGTTSAAEDSGDPVILRITVEQECLGLWDRLAGSLPLPEGFISETPENSAQPAGSSEDAAILNLRVYRTYSMEEDKSAGIDSSVFILDYRPLIPVVPLWDPRNDIDLDASLQLPLRTPDEDILPLKGLSVEGRYIDDPDYPLAEYTLLTIEWNGEGPPLSGTDREALVEWCSGLEMEPPQMKDRQLRWIAGVGDIMVQRGIQDILISQGPDGLERIFHDTLPVLQAQDFLTGNLEGAVTTGGTPTPKSYNFRFSPKVLPWLAEAGFDYFSITNNHCYDYGESGFTDTLKHLREYGIASSGGGLTITEAYAPYETAIGDFPVKVLSVGAYPREKNGFDGRKQAQVSDTRPGIIFSGPRVLESIREFSGRGSIDIVIAHGGEEWMNRPTPGQQEFYRSCIDAGADIVLGHHPHVLQGMESYNGGLIAYSLGNFLFPGMYEMPFAEETVILSIGFSGDRPVYVRPYPVTIENREIRMETPPSRIMPRFLTLTRDLE